MNISVLGGATTKFGELWNSSPRNLAKEAMSHAVEQAGLEPKDIDALFVGSMLSGILGNQANLGSLAVEEFGFFIPAFRLEAACASGGLALHNAINSILAGQYETVLVLGFEKMTDHTQDEVTSGLMAAGSDEERIAGATFPGLYALIARAYMEKYSVTEELVASVSVKNHYHGSLNPKAQYQTPITVADVMNSARIADPLKLLDCSPVSDGAAAVIITGKQAGKKSARITASEVATDTLSLVNRGTFTSLPSVVKAADKAYKKARKTAKDINVVEIHDCFSIAEVIATEDLGFSQQGMAAKDIKENMYTIGYGKTITNSSGGLKACGHPVGATGIKQIVELFDQLTNNAGKRQVDGAKVGLAHNVGGSGTIAVIHILEK